MTYVELSKAGQMTNLMVIMKNPGASVSDPSICGFTHDRIFRLKEYFSAEIASDQQPGEYKFVKVEGSLSSEGVFGVGLGDPNGACSMIFPIRDLQKILTKA